MNQNTTDENAKAPASQDQQPAPPWVVALAQEVRALLGIDDGWYIYFEVTDAPGGDADYNGSVRYNTVYLNATIQIATDLQNDPEGQRVILHEMLHIALAPLTHAFEQTLPYVPKPTRKLLRRLYNDNEEQLIQRISRAMHRTARPVESKS